MTEWQFYEIQITIKDKKIMNICGSKTEEYQIYRKLITKKDWNNHKIISYKSLKEELLNNINEKSYIEKVYQKKKKKTRIRKKTIKSKNNISNHNEINKIIIIQWKYKIIGLPI